MNIHNMIKEKLIFPIAYCLIFFISCTTVDVFEKHTVIPDQKWQSNLTAHGSFIIRDTLSAYNIYLVLRHTDAYEYNNIWLSIGLQSPGDTVYTQKVDIRLGTDMNGWEGTGMNDIWEVRKLLNGTPRRFKKPGTYFYQVGHIMREDPLLHVISVGMRIEKTKN